jgi:chromosome segregation ATPase
MNKEDLQVQFKVIGTFGAPGHTSHTLGTYNCIREARIIVDTWKDDPQYKYTNFDELKIVKHSQVTVQTSKGLRGMDNNLSDSSRLSPPAAAVDYERVGVVATATTTELKELRDLLHHLEDRHVGLRHELLSDMEDLQDDVEELREEEVRASAEINNLDEAIRHEVAGLRREMEDLRDHLRQIAPVLYVTAKDEQWKS